MAYLCPLIQYTTTAIDSRQYDNNGNLIDINSDDITYDYRNQVVVYDDGFTITTYQYDALGRRIAKSVGGNETRYICFGDRVIEEQNSLGTTLATYIYGNYIDEVLNMQRSGNNYYYHTDDMFNVMVLTNSIGNVVETYDYDDYGKHQHPRQSVFIHRPPPRQRNRLLLLPNPLPRPPNRPLHHPRPHRPLGRPHQPRKCLHLCWE